MFPLSDRGSNPISTARESFPKGANVRPNDQRNSLLDYTRFLLSAPIMPGAENETRAIQGAFARLSETRYGSHEESLRAMDLVYQLHLLKDRRSELTGN